MNGELAVGTLDERFLSFVSTVLLLETPELLLDLLRRGGTVELQNRVGIEGFALHLRGKEEKKEDKSEEGCLSHGQCLLMII